MRLTVRHETRYRFELPVRAIVQSHRLTPSAFDGQSIIDWQVSVPGAVRGACFRDGAGDWIETVSIQGPVEDLVIEVTGHVETVDLSGIVRGLKQRLAPDVYLRETRLTRPEVSITELAGAALADLGPKAGALDRAHGLAEAVTAAVRYETATTHAETTAAEALSQGVGVCQDHAHILIAAARSVGLPARYVSGYLFATSDGSPHEASHAWAEIWIDGLGWVGFDAANGVCPDDRYIRLGSGFDAADGAPIRGIAQGSADEALSVSVAVDAVQQ